MEKEVDMKKEKGERRIINSMRRKRRGRRRKKIQRGRREEGVEELEDKLMEEGDEIRRGREEV